MRIKFLLPGIISALLLPGCLSVEKRKVHIIMSPADYGWHFVKIEEDSTITDYRKIELKIDGSSPLPSIKVKTYQELDIQVYDYNGNRISDSIRLPGYQLSDSIFFSFYNPTPEDKMMVSKWMPPDMRYLQIRMEGNAAIDSLRNLRL